MTKTNLLWSMLPLALLTGCNALPDAAFDEQSAAMKACPPDQAPCSPYPTPPPKPAPKPTPIPPPVAPPPPPASNPPATLTYLNDWPSNDAHYWTEELQGITHDDTNWYLASREHIMRFALTDDLHNYPNLWIDNPWAALWSHLGSPTYAKGKVYVPLEKNGAAANRAAFGVLDTNLAIYGTAELPPPPSNIPDEQGGGDACPWMAYNPVDGLFYSSGFNPNYLYAYDIQVNPVRVIFVKALRFADTVGYMKTLDRIQGGVFSDTGKLYLISDHRPDGALLAVRLTPIQAQVESSTYVEVHSGNYEELEGVTIFDGTGKNAPGIVGQVHVLLLDNDIGQDDWYFKHYSASGTL